MAILKGVKDKIDVKVTAEVASDNGRTINVPFVTTFRKLTAEEVDQARELITVEKDDHGKITKDAADVDVIMDSYLLDWSNVPTETGEPFPYNPDNLAEMLEAPEYRDALYRGFYEATFGKVALKKILSLLGQVGH